MTQRERDEQFLRLTEEIIHLENVMLSLLIDPPVSWEPLARASLTITPNTTKRVAVSV